MAERALGEALGLATAQLEAAGTTSPRAEAEALAAYAFGVRWGELWCRLAEAVDDERLLELAQRRARGEPLAYLLGSWGFWDFEVACGPGVFVPRPETETLVRVGLDLIGGRPAPVVADLGTGTGAVALALARERPDAEVWAVERSEAALRWARRNLARTGVHLRRGDLFEGISRSRRGRIDLVVSNPPYVPEGTALPPDVLAEPPEAVFGGREGDGVIHRILAEAPSWLAEGGAVAVEVGTPDQAERTVQALDAWYEVTVTSDLAGRPRVVSARRP